VKYVDLDGGGMTRTAQYRQFLAALRHHLAGHRYDIVHAMLPVPQCDVYHPHAGIAAQAIRTNEGATRWRNVLNSRRQAFARVERHLLRGARPPIVICLSEVIKRTVRRYYSIAEDRLATLFNAVDLQKFDARAHQEAGSALRQQYHIPADALLATMIAQDFERKGLRQTLAALSLDRKTGQSPIWLLVAGRPDPTPYRRLAAKLGLEGQVVFAGAVADPRPVYAAADMLVLPTRHDPCSLVVLEALAMGLPVITTRCNGASEIMVDGEHGYVLDDPQDAVGLGKAIRRLGDIDCRRAMSNACLALRPQLAYEKHLDRLSQIYREAAKEQ
jgi:UDP-glucose:(heptosyl)LPS alpha-1,3-glucosyltransferase